MLVCPQSPNDEFDLPIPEEGRDVVGHRQGHRCLPVPWDTLAGNAPRLHLVENGL